MQPITHQELTETEIAAIRRKALAANLYFAQHLEPGGRPVMLSLHGPHDSFLLIGSQAVGEEIVVSGLWFTGGTKERRIHDLRDFLQSFTEKHGGEIIKPW